MRPNIHGKLAMFKMVDSIALFMCFVKKIEYAGNRVGGKRAGVFVQNGGRASKPQTNLLNYRCSS